jgi:hypothetical protein
MIPGSRKIRREGHAALPTEINVIEQLLDIRAVLARIEQSVKGELMGENGHIPRMSAHLHQLDQEVLELRAELQTSAARHSGLMGVLQGWRGAALLLFFLVEQGLTIGMLLLRLGRH